MASSNTLSSISVLLLIATLYDSSAFTTHSSPSIFLSKWNPIRTETTSRMRMISSSNLTPSMIVGESVELVHPSESSKTNKFRTVFDFTGERNNVKSVDNFERIDDAIMGGISTSTLRDVPNQPYASWSGVCRIDGGGFCGIRTLPFKEPLNITGSDGLFVDCRLTSDNEPNKRVWKVSLRTDPSRGEIIHQASFEFPKLSSNEEWSRIFIPFDSFQLVRGPRLIPDGPKLDVAKNGVYQIGMSLSKFQIGVNTTVLEDFRPGFFELQLRKIGVYAAADDDTAADDLTSDNNNALTAPQTMTKDEAAKNRPVLFKIISPVVKILFFSEASNRRKMAMKLLTQQRRLNRPKAIAFGIRVRSKGSNRLVAALQAAKIVAIDSFRFVMRNVFKLCLVTPIVFIRKSVKWIQKNVFRMKVKELPQME